MYKIDNAFAVAMLPAPTVPGPKVGGFYTNKTSLVVATHMTAEMMNCFQEELCNVILAASLTLDKTDRTQFKQAVDILIANATGAPSITAVHDDPNPVLGGNLDLQGHSIVSTSNGDIFFNTISTSSPFIYLNGTALVHGTISPPGDSTNQIVFGSATQTFKTNSTTRLDVNASGLRLGGANARITLVDDDTTLTANSDTRTLTQHAYKSYVDAAATHVHAGAPRYLHGTAPYGSATFGVFLATTFYLGWYNPPTGYYAPIYLGTASGVLSDFTVTLMTTTAVTCVIVVQVDSGTGFVDTALTVTVGGGVMTATDSTHSVNITNAISIQLKCVRSGNMGSSQGLNFDMKFVPT